MALTDFQTQNGGEKAFQFGNGAGFDASGNPVAAPARYTTPAAPATSIALPDAPTTADSNAPTLAPVDENAIRENTRKGMQAQIDAINANYANLVSQESVNAQDRAGQTRAVNARSGLIGSDFGAAQDTKTQQFNQQQLKSLQDEKVAKIAAVEANIEDRASTEIQNQRNYNLQKFQVDQTTFQKAQDNARADLQTLAKAGVNFDPNNASHQTLLKQAGYDAATGELLWNKMKDQSQQVNYQYESKLGAFIGVDPVTHELKKIEVPGAGPEADTMLSLITKYPDAGINLGDTLESAAAKVKNSAVFHKDTYIAPSTSPSPVGPSYVPGQNPAVDSWVQNINTGKAKFSDVPNNLLNAVAQGLAGTGSNSGSDILSTTKTSLDELNKMVTENSGFSGAVGAKGISSFFGLKSKPIGGTAAANFDAKLQQVKNDVILPNLNLLHGLGRVTDREFQALSSAVTSLNTDLSESAFRDELKNITDRINEKINAASSTNGSSLSVTTPDGQTHIFPDQKSVDAFKQAAGLK